MNRNLISLACGIIFGFGLSLSQMVNPEKVMNFLDMGGNWDPSLAFVMIGALSVTIFSFRFILKRRSPVLATSFQITKENAIDPSLMLGAAIFGIGWGMAGYCPGPAIAGVGLQLTEAIILVISIYAGFFAHRWLPIKAS